MSGTEDYSDDFIDELRARDGLPCLPRQMGGRLETLAREAKASGQRGTLVVLQVTDAELDLVSGASYDAAGYSTLAGKLRAAAAGKPSQWRDYCAAGTGEKDADECAYCGETPTVAMLTDGNRDRLCGCCTLDAELHESVVWDSEAARAAAVIAGGLDQGDRISTIERDGR
jgi:hypothetical protein